MKTRDHHLLLELRELLSQLPDKRRLRGKRHGNAADLSIHILPLMPLECFANAGHCLHSVARVETWSVKHIPVPSAPYFTAMPSFSISPLMSDETAEFPMLALIFTCGVNLIRA